MLRHVFFLKSVMTDQQQEHNNLEGRRYDFLIVSVGNDSGTSKWCPFGEVMNNQSWDGMGFNS